MSWILVLTSIGLGLAMSAFFSGAETGIYCVSRLRIHLGVRRGDRRFARLDRLLADEPGILCATLMGTNLMNYITTTAVAYLFAVLMGFSQVMTEIYTVVILTPVVFVVGEVVPKNLFQRHADILMARGSLLLELSHRLFRGSGLLWCFTRLGALASRLTTGMSPGNRGVLVPRRRVATLLQEALVDHSLGEDQSELIERVCRLSETALHAVMVPRNRVTALPADAGLRQLMRLARRTAFARLPVHDSNPRRIIGLIHVDDLLQAVGWNSVAERLEPAMELSPHLTVANATARMKTEGREMAVVADQTGNMVGIVTLKDLAEEVLGELAA